jgi:hypothetical protein
MTYVFDIDGTICTNTDGNYVNAEPIVERIELINKLYNSGNKIVYFTARGMNRYKNDIAKVYEAYYLITEHQLKRWGAKYDILRLGKPAGDLYIDDKGVKDEDFFRTNVRP